MILVNDSAVLLWGEIKCLSLLRFQGLIWILQWSNVCACANVVEAGAQAYDEASFVTWFKGVQTTLTYEQRTTWASKLRFSIFV